MKDFRSHNDLLYDVILFVGRTICVADQWLNDRTSRCENVHGVWHVIGIYNNLAPYAVFDGQA